jgi:uncharacterized protein YdcH (DUF465 family)
MSERLAKKTILAAEISEKSECTESKVTLTDEILSVLQQTTMAPKTKVAGALADLSVPKPLRLHEHDHIDDGITGGEHAPQNSDCSTVLQIRRLILKVLKLWRQFAAIHLGASVSMIFRVDRSDSSFDCLCSFEAPQVAEERTALFKMGI